MKANKQFTKQSINFWGYVRFISNKYGYSKKNNIVSYDKKNIINILKKENINVVDDNMIQLLVEYFQYRKEILQDYVEPRLMDLAETKSRYENLIKRFKNLYGDITVKQPYNKQGKGKNSPAYFTCQINLLTEEAINKFNKNYNENIIWDEDPRHLTTIKNSNNEIVATMSRRFDGAIPTISNPINIWEIKEYYYTTTFGSRISDGVYETELDGHEINNIENEENKRINHIFMCDSHYTWWKCGKSYLCRLIDALNMGLVDNIYFGSEIYDDWENYITKTLKDHLNKN